MVSVEDLIARLQENAGKLRRLGYRVRFDLTDISESIILAGTANAAIIAPAGADEPADTVLLLSSGDMAKLIAGKLSPMLAFATGKLKVEGSRGVAMKMASLLDED